MGYDGYDDGLVHGHAWASEPAGRVHARHEGMPQRHEPAPRTEDMYDDGLVHSHSWARSA